MPDKFAVMAVDPGGTTGVATGIFDSCSTVAETLTSGDVVEAYEVYGEYWDQAWVIATQFLDFAAECVLRHIAVPDIHLVFERFETRTVLAELSPVEVTAGVRVLILPRASARVGGLVTNDPPWKIGYQQPGDAKRYGTTVRLKAWALYELGRGSDHKRDALRHLALRTRRVLDGKV